VGSSRGRATTRDRRSDRRSGSGRRNSPGSQHPAGTEQRAERDAGKAARISARIGYVARGGFYAILAYLTVRVATLSTPHGATGSGGRPANANGALSLVSQTLVGKVALAICALGFLILGVIRLRAAWADHESGTMRRLSVAGQGLLYLGLTTVPTSYLAGKKSTGTERQQRKETAQMLGIPGGVVIVAVVGVGIIAICGWQLRGVFKQDFTDGMDFSGASQWKVRAVRMTGTIGIAGRALVFVPIGIWLIVTAVTFNPKNSHGIDWELLSLAGKWWGLIILACIATVMAVFAIYSLFEARYRDVTRSM
jgi:hypothetical protein